MARFVVLEHHWNGVHWDLMLDVGDCLRTWAIDAPIVAGIELPARALGDHRRVYLEYEGPVSGDRGTVKRWDEGEYEVLEISEHRIRLRMAGAQLAGVLELWRPERDASECSGGWVVRLGNAD